MVRVAEPIILIGAARSGTKFLRNLIAELTGAAAVPFDVNHIWRQSNEDLDHDEISVDSIDDEIARRIAHDIWIAADRPTKGRRLVEKTVSNTLRVPLVARVLPDAKFVHLVRPGLSVVESSHRQWTAPTDRSHAIAKLRSFPPRHYRYLLWYGAEQIRQRFRPGTAIWGPRYDGIQHDLHHYNLLYVCAKQWVRSVEMALDDLSRVSNPVHTISFDQLGDERALHSLARFLDEQPSAAQLRTLTDKFSPPAELWRRFSSAELDAVTEQIQVAQQRIDSLGR